MLIQYTPSGMGDVIHSWSDTYDFCKQTGIPFKLLFNYQREDRKSVTNCFNISAVEDGLIKDYTIGNNGQDVKIGDVIDGGKIDLIIYKVWWNHNTYPITIGNLDAEYAKMHNVLVITSLSGLGYNHSYNWKNEGKLFDLLKPAPQIQEQVDAYMKENNWTNEDRPIGMHIRRTDHKYIIKQSPTYLFINKIEELIKQNPKIRIFLCTDDVVLRHSLIENYKDNIFTRETKKRGLSGATEDALVDMFLLSKCSKIYGTGSGFCRMSSRFGHIELEKISLGSIKNLDLSDRVEIKESEFINYSGLVNVKLSDKMEKIQKCAFMNCKSMTSWDLSNCKYLNSIGNDAFKDNAKVKWFKLPDSIINLGGCFVYCHSLKEIDISNLNKVCEIADWFAYGSENLERIVFPELIMRIGGHSFGECSKLKVLDFSRCKQVPSLVSEEAFNGVPLDGLKIIVPSQLKDEWMQTKNWSGKLKSKIVNS